MFEKIQQEVDVSFGRGLLLTFCHVILTSVLCGQVRILKATQQKNNRITRSIKISIIGKILDNEQITY